MSEIKHPVHKIIWKTFGFKQEEHPIPWGSSMRFKRNLLGKVFYEAGFKHGAEIGVRRGKFSVELLKENPDLHMLCVDPWMPYGIRYSAEKQEAIYQECLKTLEGYNVTIVRKTSMDAVKDVTLESLDFVYIDGEHHFEYVIEDIIHWSNRVRSGGVIACHDYHYGRNVEVVDAVNAYIHAKHIDPWYVTKEVEPTAYWVKP